LTLTPYLIGSFAGLNVADDPFDIGAGATELNNVEIDKTGRLRVRQGYSLNRHISSVTAAAGIAAFEKTNGTRQFVVSYTTGGTKKLDAYDSDGVSASVANATQAAGAGTMSVARIGTPSNEYLYIANGADTIWRWTGAAFSQPASMPTAKFLAVSQASNRLVVADVTVPSRVIFSDAGAPETFTYDTAPTPDTGNYVDLMPGDGSLITGLANFQNDVYAFKERRFFVFYGESVGSTGAPIFNYRTVDGYGTLVPPAVGDEGVYFFDGRSIWVTSGGLPVRVSRKIDPFLRGEVNFFSATVTADAASLTSYRLFYSLGRLYVAVPKSSGGWTTLVYDPKIDEWTLWTIGNGMQWIASCRPSTTEQSYTHWFDTAGDINKLVPTFHSDLGGVVTWSWVGGAYDMGDPGATKVTTETRVWGSGAVFLQVSSDYAAFDLPSALALGTYPAIADAWQSVDREAVIFQDKLSGSGINGSGVDRIVHYVSHVKDSGIG
jgi:hypothetical protein